MTPSKTSKAKTWLLVALVVIFGTAGNVFFSVGMKRVGALPRWSPAAWHGVFAQVFSSLPIWLGIASMMLFLAAMMLVLSWADFSYVLPATAAIYVLIPLLGHFLLGEVVGPLHWLGVGLICLGIVLVGQTPANTTKRD